MGKTLSNYDPIEMGRKIENKVTNDNRRKYYRFRETNFYGGIATADCVGCNLNCLFCWSKKPREKPEEVGDFYEPEEVGDKLLEIAREEGFHQSRISGNEPTLNRDHLLEVLAEIEPSGLDFILETNGILIGNNPSYARELSSFENVHVRVSLKGCNAERFSKLTQANPDGFKLQLRSLKHLIEAGCECHASVMADFSEESEVIDLKRRLEGIDSSLGTDLELEELKLYPHVRKRLEKHGLV